MNMSDAVDKELAKQDRKQAINDFFVEKLGSTPEQAEIASRSFADNFVLTGASLRGPNPENRQCFHSTP